MPVQTTPSAASERVVSAMNGWGMLIVNLALLGAAAWLIGSAPAPEARLHSSADCLRWPVLS